MKKGFTLVELLAVIIILGLLSVMIVPKVINSINKSEEKVNMSNAQNLLNTAIYKVTNNDIQGSNQKITINYTTGENIEYLDYSGKKPEAGKVLIKSNGKIEMAVKIGDYCYKKELTENDITVKPYNKDTCANQAEMPEVVTSGDGLYDSTTDPGRLIYRGQNPNNYIVLKEDGTNNTLYRIVSYEPDGTIKVVRDEKLSTDMAWDASDARSRSNNTYCISPSYGCNAWGNGANTLYNGTPLGDSFHYLYYSSPTATTLSNGRLGTVISDSTLNTYLNDTWLSTSLSNYIDNHQWNVGGVHYGTTTDKGIVKEKEEEKQLTWIGKVGLLNITEYVEASINSGCTSVGANYAISSGAPCKNGNWTMYNKNYKQWLLSPCPYDSYGSSNVSVVASEGYFHSNGAYSVTGVRPAFYLKSTIQLAGEGTIENPYYILES